MIAEVPSLTQMHRGASTNSSSHPSIFWGWGTVLDHGCLPSRFRSRSRTKGFASRDILTHSGCSKVLLINNKIVFPRILMLRNPMWTQPHARRRIRATTDDHAQYTERDRLIRGLLNPRHLGFSQLPRSTRHCIPTSPCSGLWHQRAPLDICCLGGRHFQQLRLVDHVQAAHALAFV